MGKKNYYDLLGVSKNANTEEITNAYKKILSEYYDKLTELEQTEDSVDTEEYKEIIQEIQQAYTTLSDPDKKKTYDKYLELLSQHEEKQNKNIISKKNIAITLSVIASIFLFIFIFYSLKVTPQKIENTVKKGNLIKGTEMLIKLKDMNERYNALTTVTKFVFKDPQNVEFPTLLNNLILISEKFPDIDYKNRALILLSNKNFEIKNYKDAFYIIEKINQDNYKYVILNSIIDSKDFFNETYVYNRTIEFINSLKDEKLKTNIISDVSYSSFKEKKYEKLTDSIEKLYKDKEKYLAMEEVLSNFIRDGVYENYNILFSNYAKIAKDIKDKNISDKILVDLINNYIKLNDRVGAINLINDLSNDESKYALLLKTVKENNIQDIEKSNTFYDISLKVASSLKNSEYKRNAIKEILNKVSSNGDFDRSKSMSDLAQRYLKLGKIERALTLTYRIEDDDYRFDTLQLVIKEYIEKNKLDEALAIIESLKSNNFPKINPSIIVLYKYKIMSTLAQAYAVSKDFKKAVYLAEIVSKGSENSYITLSFIVEKYVEMKSFNEALEVIKMIKLDKDKSVQLNNVIGIYVKEKNYKNAENIFLKAIQSVDSMKNPAYKSKALINILNNYFKTSRFDIMNEIILNSLDSIKNINDDVEKLSALNYVFEKYMKVKIFTESDIIFSRYLDIVNSFEMYELKAKTLNTALDNYFEIKNFKNSNNFFSKALSILENFKVDTDKTQILQKIINKYMNIGNYEKSKEVFMEGFNVVNGIEKKSENILFLLNNYIKTNNLKINSEIFSKALDVVKTIKYSEEKYFTHEKVMQLYMNIKDFKNSDDVILKSLNTIENIEYSEYKFKALNTLIDRYIKIGNFTNNSLFFSKALNIAKNIKFDSDKSDFIIMILNKYQKTGYFENTKDIFVKSLEITNEILKINNKINTLNFILDKYLTINTNKDSKYIFIKAIEITGNIKDEEIKYKSLSGINNKYVSVGNKKDANLVFSASLNIANLIRNSYFKSMALQNISQNYVKLGNLNGAIEIINKMNDEKVKFESLNNIIENFYLSVNVNDQYKEYSSILLKTLSFIENKISDEFKPLALNSFMNKYMITGIYKDSDLIFSIILDTISPLKSKYDILNKTIDNYLKLKKFDKINDFFTKALSITNTLEKEEQKTAMLEKIINKYMITDKIKNSDSFFIKAFDVSYKIRNSEMKFNSINTIIDKIASTNSIKDTEKIYSKAVDVANSISDIDLKFSALTIIDITFEDLKK
ncbi:hypothetical protein OSSY52_09400 [Tepiditoga spiralis]|uniref:J domain-containing protein n=1 Tax=Tepiditoga spiralis TaxID=2108365 RepID=A0A7G1GB18_9BACT|nr:DnaJ domain-containing protein [Tepiditoga spiralis]BBE30799.1 hypothetical protein OSSY52_09400 [Tepiditoga spiralis]